MIYYLSRKRTPEVSAFMAMDENSNVFVYALAAYQRLHQIDQVATLTDDYLIDEIEERPTWNSPMSERLKALSESLWQQVRKTDPFYAFTAVSDE
jgi:hypothetical protein